MSDVKYTYACDDIGCSRVPDDRTSSDTTMVTYVREESNFAVALRRTSRQDGLHMDGCSRGRRGPEISVALRGADGGVRLHPRLTINIIMFFSMHGTLVGMRL